ncbi:MAG: glycosyltransferase family 9 protein [Nitrospinae bacterium]|nr:glycosyltransferase family 9 protein [Nitrospinota bacterium]
MKRILAISVTGLGDSLWGTPALRALKKSFPGARVDFLVDARWAPLFRGNPHIDRILEYRKPWLFQFGFKFGLLRETYDHALIFHANRDVRRVLPWLRSRQVLAHQNFDFLPEDQRIPIDGPLHGIQRRWALIEKIGAAPDGARMELFLDGRDAATAAEFMEKNRLAPREFVYLNVGASLAHKRWLPERFVALAQKLSEDYPYKIVLGAGPGEKPLVDSISAQLDPSKTANACDRPVRDNACLIGQARLMVTCDSGPMHIGFALKVPAVALFGVSDPGQSGPFGLDDNLCWIVRSPVNPYFHAAGDRAGANGPDLDRPRRSPPAIRVGPVGSSGMLADDRSDCFRQISLDMAWEKVREALALSPFGKIPPAPLY